MYQNEKGEGEREEGREGKEKKEGRGRRKKEGVETKGRSWNSVVVSVPICKVRGLL